MLKVSSFVLKIASRCNLNCSYCYMYNKGDLTYLKQPKFMKLDVIMNFAEKLKEYTLNNSIEYVQIVFHGGEPLLQKKEYFKNCISIFKEIAPHLEYNFTVQTNGVLLDQDWFELFKKLNISVGISFDGPKRFHDKDRIFHNGKGSYDLVANAIRLGNKNKFSGILMVLNIDIPVEDFYFELKKLKINKLSLLLPDGHYDSLPDGFDSNLHNENFYTPYADWLIEFYTLWKEDKNRPSISFFETIICLLVGQNVGNQLIGTKANGVVVLESDGGIEVVDSLKACYEGITRNPLNIRKNRISDLFDDKVFKLYYHAHDKVCEQCLNCPVYDVCGGGFFGHRYSKINGFDNPTIYCKDMIKFITFIQNDFINSLDQDSRKKLNIEPISYNKVILGFEDKPKIKIEKELKKALISFNRNS